MYTDQLFTGQRELAGLGIYHYGARFYSPKLGRFLSADTMVPNAANPQDFNRYSYVRNNPVRYVDPTGHFICSNDRNSDDYCPGRTSIIGSNGSSGSSTTTSPQGSTGGGGGGGGGENPCTSVVCLPTSTSQPPTSSPETVTTVNIGGVNPANVPGNPDDDSVPVLTNIQGRGAVGIPTLIAIISPIIQRPSSSTNVDVWLNYTTLSNGAIDTMVVALYNRTSSSAVDLSGVIIDTQRIIGSAESSYLRPINYVGVGPGQIEHAVVCNNCIATNVLGYDMPIDRNTEITITVMVGATYNFGLTGTTYRQLPVSYVIPPR